MFPFSCSPSISFLKWRSSHWEDKGLFWTSTRDFNLKCLHRGVRFWKPSRVLHVWWQRAAEEVKRLIADESHSKYLLTNCIEACIQFSNLFNGVSFLWGLNKSHKATFLKFYSFSPLCPTQGDRMYQTQIKKKIKIGWQFKTGRRFKGGYLVDFSFRDRFTYIFYLIALKL